MCVSLASITEAASEPRLLVQYVDQFFGGTVQVV